MDFYADRLAKQAVIVALAYQRWLHEMEVMDSIVRGTPPNLWPKAEGEQSDG